MPSAKLLARQRQSVTVPAPVNMPTEKNQKGPPCDSPTQHMGCQHETNQRYLFALFHSVANEEETHAPSTACSGALEPRQHMQLNRRTSRQPPHSDIIRHTTCTSKRHGGPALNHIYLSHTQCAVLAVSAYTAHDARFP